MRAAIIGSANFDYAGGAERTVEQLARFLHSRGYSVTVFSIDYENHNVRSNHNDSAYKEMNAFSFDLFSRKRIVKLSHGTSMGLVGLFSFWRIWEMIEGFDLYYFPYPSILLGNFMKYSYRLGKNPQIIVANHGTYFEMLEHRKITRKLFMGGLTEMIFEYAKKMDIKIHVQNTAQYNFYRYVIGINPENIYLIPQCDVDFNRYTVGNNSSFRVVFLNKIAKNKGMEKLFTIIRKAPDISFDIVGYHDNIEKIKRKFTDCPNVIFHGYVSEERKIEILKNADLMINLSRYESLSTSTVEGLASGLMVIGPRISGIQYISDKVPKGVILSDLNHISIIEQIRKVKEIKEGNMTRYFLLKTGIREEARRVFNRDITMEMLGKMLFGESEIQKAQTYLPKSNDSQSLPKDVRNRIPDIRG